MEISTWVSKMLRKNFGRGPETCQAFLRHPYLTVTIRGFLSPMEVILLENGHLDSIESSRRIVMNSVLNQLKGVLEVEFDQDVLHFYHDWNFERNTGMIIAVFEGSAAEDDNAADPFPEREALTAEAARISLLVEKTPERTEAYRITPKLYLVKRTGILVPIEKALIAKGYQQALLVTKDELEISYFRREGRFEEIFRQSVAELFVDWNFAEDNSLLGIVLA
ncbi:Na-translocating system protein MpsC family protein [Paenibacillus xanthanilyticus]